jgi:tetratricopeptide (TPR) repeat protein
MLRESSDARSLQAARAVEAQQREAAAEGVKRLNKGDYDGAIAYLNDAIRFYPKSAIAYNSRGNGYYHKNDYDHAIADYTQAIRRDSQFAIAYSDRGDAYEKKGELQWAMADYRLALRFDASLQ